MGTGTRGKLTLIKKRYDRVVVVGSVGFDQIANLPGRFAQWIMPDKIHQLNVSFTVSSLRKEFGGTGGNCAYTLGLLGVGPLLIGTLGTDGAEYVTHLRQAGVDIAQLTLVNDSLSASGQVMTDLGDNQIWSYYPGPLREMKDIALAGIVKKSQDLVALLPSEPTSFVTHLTQVVKAKIPFLFDPAFFIPNLTRKELVTGLEAAEIVIGNDYEIELLQRRTKTTMAKWLHDQMAEDKIIIRTLGESGSEIYTRGSVIRIPAARVKKVVDPTGAGDAYRAGFLAGYVGGKELITCGRMGAIAAAYTVETYGTQTHSFSQRQFWARLRNNFP